MRYTPVVNQLSCGCWCARWEERQMAAHGGTPLEAVDKLKAKVARQLGSEPRADPHREE